MNGNPAKRLGCSIIFSNDNNEILLFLRDNKPDIPNPNMWDLLGGHVEENETPEQCIIREMNEEIGLDIQDIKLFSVEELPERIEYTFWKKMNIDISKIKLTEGQKLKWFTEKEIKDTNLAGNFNVIINNFFRYISSGDYKSNSSSNVDLLIAEYNQCFNNYAYRDQLIPNEFFYTILLIVAIIGVGESLGDVIGRYGLLIIYVLGLFILYILHLDLMANTSSKRVAIDRAKEIERMTDKYNYNLKLARMIGEQSKKGIEKILSIISTCSNLIIWFVRIFIIFWIVYGCYMIYTN